MSVLSGTGFVYIPSCGIGHVISATAIRHACFSATMQWELHVLYLITIIIKKRLAPSQCKYPKGFREYRFDNKIQLEILKHTNKKDII